MLSALVLFFWFIVFSYTIYRLVRNHSVSMNFGEVLIAFGCKVLAGCLYGYVFLHYYDGDDTWLLHHNAIKEKQMLLENPSFFFSEFTPAAAIRNGKGFIDSIRLYLYDLEYCLQPKVLAMINLITRDNYYINVVFWNFFLFWGHYLFFKTLTANFPALRTRYYILVFLFPPALFWLSGIRGDGLVFLSFSMVFYYFHRWLTAGGIAPLLAWILGFIGLLIFRTPVAALLIPALLSWGISHRPGRKPLLVFASIYALAILIFFGGKMFTGYNLASTVVNRQAEFMRLHGTSFDLDTLQPTIRSFATVLPQSALNTFARPHPLEAKGLLQQAASMEIVFFWVFCASALTMRSSEWKTIFNHPLILACIFFGVTLYIFIGYVVPFPGAIVRYKIIGELSLLAVMATVLRRKQKN